MRELQRRSTSGIGRTAVSGLLALVFCYAAIFVPMPYYMFKPGTAEAVGPMVRLSQDAGPEQGTFMLTTVGLVRANFVRLFEAKLRRYDLRKVSDIRESGETSREFDERQHDIMLTSQANAIQAAYRKAGVAYHLESLGLTVLRTAADSFASGVLEAGDRIMSVDGKPVKSGKEWKDALHGKQAGDSVRVGYRRGEAAYEADFALRKLADPQPQQQETAGERLGIGTMIGEVQAVRAEKPELQAAIEAGEIGGPSAGFMFAMEIYNRLTPEDWTKGYRIAGTGTIDPEGNVGSIGGIRYKVAAADREGADIFFAPRDQEPGSAGDPLRNATEAAEAARRLGASMTIVPVGTMDEALEFLAGLEPKAVPLP